MNNHGDILASISLICNNNPLHVDMKKEGGKRGGGGTCKHDNFKIFGFDCSGCYTYFYTNKTAFVSVLFTKFLMVLLF